VSSEYVLFIFQFRAWLTWPDLPIRDSRFLKVAQRPQWRAEAVQPGWRLRASKGRWASKEWNCKN